MSNRKTGTDFEKELCEILSEHGFWVHNMGQKAAGQPFDIIAVRDNVPLAIDAKVCEKNEFPLSRIEENQHNAMWLWYACRNDATKAGFALKLPDGKIMFLDYSSVKYLIDRGKKVLRDTDIVMWATDIEKLVRI